MTRKRGRPSHPVDIDLAADMRHNPGTWFAYPVVDRWPGEDPADPATIRRLAARLNVRCYGAYGTYAPTPEGRYRTRFDAHEGRLEMCWMPTKENTAE